MKEVTLETERLLLRFPRESDFEAYAKICADREVMRFLGGQPMTELEAWRHMAFTIGHWYFRGYGQWVVEEKASGRLVGRIGFTIPRVGPVSNWAGRWDAKAGAKATRLKALAARSNTRSPK